MPSLTNPEYTAYIVVDSTKYNVTPALIAADRSEEKKGLAQCVTLQLANVKVGNKYLSELITVRSRVYLYANDGSGADEVFRGYIWTNSVQDSMSEQDFTVKCYDNLIFWQESEASEWFASGLDTETVVKKICDNWGVKLEYNYHSITNPKMALRGYLSDILTADVLDPVKERLGKDYTILSIKDVLTVNEVGQNKTIYHIIEGRNATSTSYEITMNGMITKVVILGTADNDDREPVEATLDQNSGKYGTLQKIIRRSGETTLEEAKEEGQNLLDENSTPKCSYRVKAPDIPWIRKGDKVYVNAGCINGKYLIVDDIDHTVDSTTKEMTLTLSEPLKVKAQTAKQEETEYNKKKKEKDDYNRQRSARAMQSKFEYIK